LGSERRPVWKKGFVKWGEKDLEFSKGRGYEEGDYESDAR